MERSLLDILWDTIRAADFSLIFHIFYTARISHVLALKRAQKLYTYSCERVIFIRPTSNVTKGIFNMRL